MCSTCGKGGLSSPVGRTWKGDSFFLTLNIKITHQDRQGLSSHGRRRRPFPRGAGRAASRPPPCGGLQRGPAPSPRPRGSFPPGEPASGAAGGRPAGPTRRPLLLARSRTFCFLPRTKDNKRSRGATHRVRTPRPTPPGRLHPTPAPGRPPEPPARTGRAAGAPGGPRRPLRSDALRVVGPAAPGASAAGSQPGAQPASPRPQPLLPRVCGPPGRRSPAGGLRGRGGTPDSSGVLLPLRPSCAVCVWCLSPVSSLGSAPSSSSPPPHTPHNMASSLRRRLLRRRQQLRRVPCPLLPHSPPPARSPR